MKINGFVCKYQLLHVCEQPGTNMSLSIQIQSPAPDPLYTSYKSNLPGNFSPFRSITAKFKGFNIKAKTNPNNTKHPQFKRKDSTSWTLDQHWNKTRLSPASSRLKRLLSVKTIQHTEFALPGFFPIAAKGTSAQGDCSAIDPFLTA